MTASFIIAGDVGDFLYDCGTQTNCDYCDSFDFVNVSCDDGLLAVQ
jgi:hypothetical protein